MENKELIAELYQCASECNVCYESCLKEEDVAMLERCMMLDKECFDVCELTARILERGSEHTDLFLNLCAKICEACADECSKHEHEHCQSCARECRHCAEKCLSYQTT